VWCQSGSYLLIAFQTRTSPDEYARRCNIPKTPHATSRVQHGSQQTGGPETTPRPLRRGSACVVFDQILDWALRAKHAHVMIVDNNGDVHERI